MTQKSIAKSEVFDIQIDPSHLADEDERRKVLEAIEFVLKSFNLNKQSQIAVGNDTLVIFTTSSGVHAIIRTHEAGLITVILEEPNADSLIFTEPVVDELLRKLRSAIKNATKIIKLFYIKRGLPIDVYTMSTDKRILEYDFDKLLFENDSEHQHIRLVHSMSYGNMLWLDNLQNLSEQDLTYTHSLMNKGSENYAGKTILILGGGDGALLHELLKENPKFVTMVDIDRVVIEQCKIHLRNACGDALDQYIGNRHQILVDDALKVMDEYTKEGRQFDYIFNDLTDVPVSHSPMNAYWSLIENILRLALNLLKPDGKYFNHATSYNAVAALKKYENLLENSQTEVTFRNYDAHVPSFMERWVFYEIQKKKNK